MNTITTSLSACFHERILYYWRHGLYGHTIYICRKLIEARNSDLFLNMWLSLSLAILKQTNSAIEEIRRMANRSDLSLLFNLCKYYIYKNAVEPDQTEIEKIQQKINSFISSSNDFCLFSSGLISYAFGDLEFAVKFADLIKNEDVSLPLYGWIALSRQEYQKAHESFDKILSNHLKSNDLLSLYGKAILLAETGDYSNSIQLYAKISSHFDFPEIQFEKARIFISMNKWSLAYETITNTSNYSSQETATNPNEDNKIKNSESKENSIDITKENIKENSKDNAKENSQGFFSFLETHIIQLINVLLTDNDILTAVQIMKDIEDDIQIYESKNWRLCLEFCKTILSICHQTPEIVDRVINIIEIASKESPQVLPFLSYCHIMKHDILNSTSVLNQIQEQDEDIYSIESRLLILFESQRISEASDQLELYRKISNNTIQLKTLDVKLFRLQNGCTGKNVYELCRLVLNHIDTILSQQRIYNQDSNQKISSSKSDFPQQQHEDNSEEKISISKSEFTPSKLPLFESKFGQYIISNEEFQERFYSKYAPLEVNFERFMFYFGQMRFDSIVSALDEIVLQNKSLTYFPDGQFGEKIDLIFKRLFKIVPNLTPLRLQYAIFLQLNEKYSESMNIIQSYLIQRWPFRLPLSFLTAAINEYFLGNVEESKKYLESTLQVAPIFNSYLDLILLKCRIDHNLTYLPEYYDNLPFITLLKIIDLALECDDYEKSRVYFQTAASIAKQPKEKAHLIIRQAKILAFKKDFKKAFNLLKNLANHQKYIDEAVTAEAHIYLHYLDDYDNYMLKYEELCEQSPTVSHFLMTGDAFCQINEYDSAVTFYESAYKLSSEPEILERLSTALIKSHQFNLAVTRYKMIGCTPLFLIKMLYKLKKFTKAKQYLEHSIRLIRTNQMLTIAPYIELRGDVHSVLRENAEALEDYRSALKIYISIFDVALPNVYITELKSRASELARKIGDLTPTLEKVLSDYYMSLDYDPTNVDSFVSIFNFFKNRNDLKKCHELCIDFLSKSQSETVALLLTTIETRDFTSSIKSLENVLNIHPRFHRALVRLVEICARAGKLEIAEKRLEKYVKKNDESPGILFSRGLLNLYTGNISDALKFFTMSGKNRRWMISSKLCMFNLLVNPERKYIWCETEPLTTQENINAASEILSSFKNLDEVETMLLTAELFIAHNNEDAIKNAMKIFYQIIDIEQHNIPALVGLARCHLRLGNVKATNVFIDKVFFFKPFHENYSYFEECYLMRASIISEEQDYRSSQQFIYLALDLNLSSKKGWEMSGFVHMQNKMYSEAALAFSRCWKLGDKKDKQIGYNYAYCSLMGNRPDQALVICRKLLDDNPEFTELLEKVMLPAFKMLKS